MTFKPGQSGNPAGKRNEKRFFTALDMALKAEGKDDKRLRRVAEQLVKKAEAGEAWAIREIADRLDGKSDANVNVTGNHTVTHESADVSETAGWIADMLGTGAGKPPKDTLPN